MCNIVGEACAISQKNVVMVGALSAFSDFPIKKDIMLEAVKNIVPKKAVEVNIKAFKNGLDAFNKIKGGNNMDKYVCTVCGYVYDPEAGDPDSGIKPGTAFEDLPNDWVCPLCGVGKDQFEKEE